jgi:hypothetical protein
MARSSECLSVALLRSKILRCGVHAPTPTCFHNPYTTYKRSAPGSRAGRSVARAVRRGRGVKVGLNDRPDHSPEFDS